MSAAGAGAQGSSPADKAEVRELAWSANRPKHPRGRARQQGDIVVMGSHGRGSVKGLLLGSVSSKVIAQAELPVTIVR